LSAGRRKFEVEGRSPMCVIFSLSCRGRALPNTALAHSAPRQGPPAPVIHSISLSICHHNSPVDLLKPGPVLSSILHALYSFIIELARSFSLPSQNPGHWGGTSSRRVGLPIHPSLYVVWHPFFTCSSSALTTSLLLGIGVTIAFR